MSAFNLAVTDVRRAATRRKVCRVMREKRRKVYQKVVILVKVRTDFRNWILRVTQY